MNGTFKTTLSYFDAIFVMHCLDILAKECEKYIEQMKDEPDHAEYWKQRAETCNRIRDQISESYEEDVRA